MSVKIFIDNLDDAPEALRDLYEENPEGGFKLPIEEKLVPEDKLNRVQKKLDGFKDYVKPEDHQKIVDALEAAQNEGDIETKVTNRVKELQDSWETEKNDLTSKVNQYETQISQSALKSALTEAATKAGVKTSAIEDIILRGGNVFKYVEGNVKAFDDAGEERFYQGTKAYTPDHWLKELKTNAGHLFEENVGGGAVGGLKTKPMNTGGNEQKFDRFGSIAEGLKNQ